MYRVHLDRYVAETVGADAFCVGEDFLDLNWQDGRLSYNQDGPRQGLVDWATEAGNCAIFDFVLKGVLQVSPSFLSAANISSYQINCRDGRSTRNGACWVGKLWLAGRLFLLEPHPSLNSHS